MLSASYDGLLSTRGAEAAAPSGKQQLFDVWSNLYDAEKKERALLTTPTGRELSVCSSVDVTVSTVERMERGLSVWKYFLYAAIQSVAMSEYPSVATLLQLWPLLTVSSETIVC